MARQTREGRWCSEELPDEFGLQLVLEPLGVPPVVDGDRMLEHPVEVQAPASPKRRRACGGNRGAPSRCLHHEPFAEADRELQTHLVPWPFKREISDGLTASVEP